MDQVRSAKMTWQQVEEANKRGAAAIFPLGSTEEHGPHVPMGDFLIAEEVAVRVAQRTDDIVFPCLPFGYSEYFRHYPGTVTLQDETLFRVVEDVVNCLIAHGFKHIVIFNGHKGNWPTLSHLIRKIRYQQGILIPVVSPLGFALTSEVLEDLYGNDGIGHGGEPMGSITTYLFPGSVDLDLAEEWGRNEFHGLRATLSGVIFEGCDVGLAVNMEDIAPPSGSLSNPLLATEERGKRIVNEAVDRLARFMRWFKGVDPVTDRG